MKTSSIWIAPYNNPIAMDRVKPVYLSKRWYRVGGWRFAVIGLDNKVQPDKHGCMKMHPTMEFEASDTSDREPCVVFEFGASEYGGVYSLIPTRLFRRS